jgi:hypothetical protein
MLNLLNHSVAVSTVVGGSSAAAPGLSASDGMIASLTMEGLLFAAFSIGYALSGPTREGRSRFYTQGWFGWCIVAVIALVAAGAAACWWEVFGSGTGWPGDTGEALLGLGLGAGIATQPIFAGVINHEAKRE